MKTKKLFELLKKVQIVNSKYNNWKHVQYFIKGINDNTIVEEETIWFKSFYYDLKNSNTWSTYENLINITFYTENNKLKTRIKICNGDLNGRWVSNKFNTTLILPNNYISNLEDSILSAVDNYVEMKYEKYLLNQKQIWMENLKKKILDDSF